MKIDIDLNCFFDGTLGYDLRSVNEYKKNLDLCQEASEKIIAETKNKSNEIINSFSRNYQEKIKLQKLEISEKKNKLVIGLGGSSAGAKAVNAYLEEGIYFFDNYDPGHLSNFFKNYNLKDFTIYIISKSGTTFETMAMLNLTYQHLIKILTKEEIKKNLIIITEDSDNPLNNFAKKNDFQLIAHNKKIGGRYSVFSEVGMILFDLDALEISSSAESVILKLIDKNQEDQSNPVVNAAVILTLQKNNDIRFNINLLYEYTLKNYSYWFHQLFAESLGKDKKAITPMTSICPKDHHSMMQLFIDGPKDKLFNIYPPPEKKYFEKFSSLDLGDIEKISPDNLLKSQYLGLVQTFKNQKIPHRIFNRSSDPAYKASNIMELFAYNILETIILGYAQNINPYDQPAVEQIKLNTFSS
jgi:glucose-6-phosphate isomerase